jgi:hypothetical protein
MKLSLTPALGFSGVASQKPEPSDIRQIRPKGRKGAVVDAVRPVAPEPPSTPDTET